jgi:hypothetical protein
MKSNVKQHRPGQNNKKEKHQLEITSTGKMSTRTKNVDDDMEFMY